MFLPGKDPFFVLIFEQFECDRIVQLGLAILQVQHSALRAEHPAYEPRLSRHSNHGGLICRKTR